MVNNDAHKCTQPHSFQSQVITLTVTLFLDANYWYVSENIVYIFQRVLIRVLLKLNSNITNVRFSLIVMIHLNHNLIKYNYL